MKTSQSPLLRSLILASLASLVGLGATIARAAGAPTSSHDPAAHLLERDGSVAVIAAGPFVEPGTFRVQVSTKLGRPDLVLADGTWLYHHRRIDDSAAEGTLVVRFKSGRVSSLALVTPAVVASLRANSRKPAPEILAAK